MLRAVTPLLVPIVHFKMVESEKAEKEYTNLLVLGDARMLEFDMRL